MLAMKVVKLINTISQHEINFFNCINTKRSVVHEQYELAGQKEILLIPQGVVETEIQAMEQFFFDDLAGRS